MAKKKSLTANTFLNDLVRDTTSETDEQKPQAREKAAPADPVLRQEAHVPYIAQKADESPEPEMVKVTFRYRPEQIAAMRILGFADRFNTQQDYVHQAIDALLEREDIKNLLDEGRDMYVRYLEKKVNSGKKLNEIDQFIFQNYRR